MHGSSNGLTKTAGPYLMKGSDGSSVCLNCHQLAGAPGPQGVLVSTADPDMPPGTPPRQLGPAGDFGWLKKSYSWIPPGGTTPLVSPGERHGHNVVALDYGYLPDGLHPVAPAGSYPSASLQCSSCHDPHGAYRRVVGGTVVRTGLPITGSGSLADGMGPTPTTGVGSYRMLAGAGYQPRSIGGNVAFVNAPPVALAPVDFNRPEAVAQTRVAYGSGMSEWCTNCHTGIAVNGETQSHSGLGHPVGPTATLDSGVVANYVAYVGTNQITNTDPSRAYWSLVPFEEGVTDATLLVDHARSDDGYLAGPSTRSSVSCLTCHRAHASGFDGMTRFRADRTSITVGDPLGASAWPEPALNPGEAQGRTAAETQQAYYGRPATLYPAFQQRLCNKCHPSD